ncbi:hypothetical protein FH972_025702 [Carpinus fangiana]|uniref:Uncharacterized protein n=1 Tax=Carpinus fangiana TaxID=176857 RepID=A0A5N6L273_9ROSI|nr:hypothetical protein FH972_025702 [Carpinus fangiana]
MASPFTLPLRTRLSPSTPSRLTQIRHASGPSTPRRARKALNIPPAPHAGGSSISAGGTSGRSHQPHPTPLTGSSGNLGTFPAGDRIVYAPPSSAPTPFHTPAKFLPRDDPRSAALSRLAAAKQQHLQQHQRRDSAQHGTGLGGERLPPTLPPTRRPTQHVSAASSAAGAPHLSATAVAEMRALRREDEEKWTATRLAERFGCSRFFVGLVVQASPERRRVVQKEVDAVRARWGRKRRVARMERGMRKELWGRDE